MNSPDSGQNLSRSSPLKITELETFRLMISNEINLSFLNGNVPDFFSFSKF